MESLLTKVWKLKFRHFESPSTKFVCLAVARRSFGSGCCWASQATLADDTDLSTKTVARCLAELEAHGWIKRTARLREDGGRGSDKIWLTLPRIVLEQDVEGGNAYEDTPWLEDQKPDFDAPPPATLAGGVNPCLGGAPSPGNGGGSPYGVPGSSKGSVEEEVTPLTPKGGVGAIPESEIQKAVSLIWDRSSDMGRQRSSKGDITDGLKAALRRGNTLEAVLRGLGAYFASPDATKDDGAFQRGIHRILAKDRWKDFADSAPPSDQMRNELFSPPGGDGPPKPNEALQRAWMMSWRSGVGWNEGRGPAPGRMGCLVTPAIEREFGSQPYVDRMREAEQRASLMSPTKGDIVGHERLFRGLPSSNLPPSPPGDADEDPAAFD